MSRGIESNQTSAATFQSGRENSVPINPRSIFLTPGCPVIINPLEFCVQITNRWVETAKEINNGTKLYIEAQSEMEGTNRDIQDYKRMPYSHNIQDRELYYGEGLSRENPKKILIANGFSPSPEIMLEVVEEKMAGPYAEYYRRNPFVQMGRAMKEQFIQNMQKLSGFKSNEMLEDFKNQLTRWGHDADFAFEGPNDFKKDSFEEFEQRVEDETRDGSTVYLAGLSKGGADAEIIAKRHERNEKNGHVVVIKIASPRVSERANKLFDESIPKHGLTGLVHSMAHRSADKKMLQIYENEARAPLHPEIARNMVSYIVLGDRVVINDQEVIDPFEDQEDTGVIIPIRGHHASAPYSKDLLRDLGPRLAQPSPIAV